VDGWEMLGEAGGVLLSGDLVDYQLPSEAFFFKKC